jgi:energy-coupling factor transporter transmembrane protein EcfT
MGLMFIVVCDVCDRASDRPNDQLSMAMSARAFAATQGWTYKESKWRASDICPDCI